MKKLPVMLIKPTAVLPERKTGGSVGYDISACLEQDIVIKPGETRMVGSGFAIALKPGYAAFIYARSGLGIKQGIIPANCVGVIDSDYRGEVIVGLRNTSAAPFTVKNGDRIAQMVITKTELPEVLECENLDETTRGDGGFGSTD
jgi:dUTP pyrophosphatase